MVRLALMILWMGSSYFSFARDFHLNLQWNNYLYAQMPKKTSLNYPNFYSAIASDIVTKQQGKHWFYDFDSQMQLSVDGSHQHYLSISSANIGYQLKDIVFLNPYLTFIEASLGRHNKEWSWMDEHWRLGLWNPRNLYDPLRPKRQGFVGTTITIGGDYWYITNFSSGIFVPNQGLSFNNDSSGQFQSTSRWVFLPPSQLSIFNESVQSYYWIQKPYIKNVLLQYTYLGKLFLGHLDSKWVSFSYANKPLNQIFYAIETSWSIPDSAITNHIHYHSLRHQLMELNTGWTVKNTRVKIGILKEVFSQSDPLPDNWIIPLVEEILMASVTISKNFNIGHWMSNSIAISYLRPGVIKKRMAISDTKPDLSSIVFFDRLKMKEGFSLSWMATMLSNSRKWADVFVRYWHSIDQEGTWLSLQLSLFILKELSINIECDILGTTKSFQEGFLSKYGSNDRLILGIQYDF